MRGVKRTPSLIRCDTRGYRPRIGRAGRLGSLPVIPNCPVTTSQFVSNKSDNAQLLSPPCNATLTPVMSNGLGLSRCCSTIVRSRLTRIQCVGWMSLMIPSWPNNFTPVIFLWSTLPLFQMMKSCSTVIWPSWNYCKSMSDPAIWANYCNNWSPYCWRILTKVKQWTRDEPPTGRHSSSAPV